MFDDVPGNVVYCINSRIIDDLIETQIKYKKCPVFDCSNNWKSKQKKLINNNNNECVESCDNSTEYPYEYNGKCYEKCTKGYLLDESGSKINKCKCELDQCLLCPNVASNKNLCTKCNINYYQKENDPSNLGEYINCYKDLEGYYLDNNLYKQCYYACKTCNISGNNRTHNCIECNDKYKFKIENGNYLNCYEECSYYYYFDEENNYHCTEYSSCPKEYPKLNANTSESIKTDIKDIIQDLKKAIKLGNDETEYYDNIINIIEQAFTSENYVTSKLDNGEDELIQIEKMTVTLTTIENQKNNINNNMTSIILGQCEDELRSRYNVYNATFYMKKIDVEQDGIKIPKIKFDVYCKLNGTKLVKLDLSLCEKTKIYFSIPTELTDDIYKLNASSEYYNDKCVSAKSDSGTDIIQKDRQKEFVEGDKTLCQENCDFSEYNMTNKRANCSCYIKEYNLSFAYMYIDKNKLYENFENSNDKNTFSNLGITSCDVLSSTENIKSNPGFFSLILILAIFIIIFIIFSSKGYNLLENKMDEVIHKKFQHKNKKNKKIKKSVHIHNKKPKNKRNSKKMKEKNKKLHNINISGKMPLKVSSVSNMILINQTNNIAQVFQNGPYQKTNTFNSKLKPDTDYELNWLSYEEALIYDKRTFCDYYGSLIRSKQLFIFTFCSFNDYNSGIIKKFMFFLSFALHYTTNALFFDESNLHQIYEDEGKFNITYQLPKIIFSALISTFVLRLILQFLVLTDKDILTVKNQLTQNMAINMKIQKLKYMKIKFTFFFILNFILLGLFWYYLTCFNAVYKNTQIYLIENTFISFGFSLFYPFIVNIFPTMIRMCSIHSSNKNQSYCYKVSQIIQLI